MSAVKVTWSHDALVEANLKSFTLRDRHWAEVHAATGEHCDVTVELDDVRFVLDNRMTLNAEPPKAKSAVEYVVRRFPGGVVKLAKESPIFEESHRFAAVVQRVGSVVLNLPPTESLEVICHSPDGFECGYVGSGPAQLALAIMLDHFKSNHEIDAVRLARSFYQYFKHEFIVAMPRDGGRISKTQIDAFVERMQAI